jgi:cytochrome c2
MTKRLWFMCSLLVVASLHIGGMIAPTQFSHAQDPVQGDKPVAVAAKAKSTELVSPFVASFDRFARSEQIDAVLGGKLLITELNCTACHQTPDKDMTPKKGPRLNSAGVRLTPDWMHRYLDAPQHVKPGSTMPDMLEQFSGPEKSHVIDALVAFLSSLQEPIPEIKGTGLVPVVWEFWKKGSFEKGQKLFHQVGCIACHEPDQSYQGGSTKESALDQLVSQLDAEQIAEMGLTNVVAPVNSVPLGDLKAKYTDYTLAMFLHNPALDRPGGRMPSLKLMPNETADLAAYLLKKDAKKKPETAPTAATPKIDPALVKEGKELFLSLKCVNCHTAESLQPKQFAQPLATLMKADKSQTTKTAGKTCLAPTSSEVPHYHLDQLQTASLTAALEQLAKQSDKTVADRTDLKLLQLNCLNCHERNDRGGVGFNRQKYFETVGHVDIGDEGRLPPPLSRVGYKLQNAWLRKVLQGDGDIRPFMHVRMPKFPGDVLSSLPELLQVTDMLAQHPDGKQNDKPKTEQEVFGKLNTELAKEGRVLLDTGCVQCHVFRAENLPSVVGVDLENATNRITPQYFREFLLDPAALKQRTRMPTFFPHGKSSSPQILHGDVDQQIASIWLYLKTLDKQPLPEKILQAKSADFELVPKDHPLVLRTFMDQAGVEAIAVGFPEKVNYAFDAENIRLVQAWKGKYIDARSTWFDRFTPPAPPLGDHVIELPASVPFAELASMDTNWPTTLADDNGYRFHGYQLDAKKIPTMKYQTPWSLVQDKISATDKQGLHRSIKLIPALNSISAQKIWFRILTGKTLKALSPTQMQNDQGLIVDVKQQPAETLKLRQTSTGAEWLMELPTDREVKIEVDYQW